MKASLNILALTSVVALLGACAAKDGQIEAAPPPAPPAIEHAHAEGQSTNKRIKLVVHFDKAEDGVEAKIRAEGMRSRATQAIHVHEHGVCTPPSFESAGGHFNPTGAPHGDHKKDEAHLGDLGNLKANAKGVAEKTVMIKGAQLDGENGLIGRSVVLHAKADDLKSQPAGNSGPLVVCAVIAEASESQADDTHDHSGHAH